MTRAERRTHWRTIIENQYLWRLISSFPDMMVKRITRMSQAIILINSSIYVPDIKILDRT